MLLAYVLMIANSIVHKLVSYSASEIRVLSVNTTGKTATITIISYLMSKPNIETSSIPVVPLGLESGNCRLQIADFEIVMLDLLLAMLHASPCTHAPLEGTRN
jgi:hypothetical protein